MPVLLSGGKFYTSYQPFPKRQILDSSKLKEFADDIYRKLQKVLKAARKHSGKRRNCS